MIDWERKAMFYDMFQVHPTATYDNEYQSLETIYQAFKTRMMDELVAKDNDYSSSFALVDKQNPDEKSNV